MLSVPTKTAICQQQPVPSGPGLKFRFVET